MFYCLLEENGYDFSQHQGASDTDSLNENWNIDENDVDDTENYILNDNNCASGNHEQNEQDVSFHDRAKNYLIKIKESHRLSNKATQNIACVTSALLEEACLQLEEKVKRSLDDANINYEDIPGIAEAFDEFAYPFQGLGEMSTDCLKNEPNFVVSSMLSFHY